MDRKEYLLDRFDEINDELYSACQECNITGYTNKPTWELREELSKVCDELREIYVNTGGANK